MNRLRAMLSLFALAAMSVGSAMAASPREVPEYYLTPPPETSEEGRSRRAAEMEAALGRMVGRFGIEHPYVFSDRPSPVPAARTMMDCVAIGAGKGVHCVLVLVSVSVRPQTAPLRSGGPLTAASITEYGLDPNASRVRAMTVTQSSALLLAGTVSSDTLAMWAPCWDMPEYLPYCEFEQKIAVLEDGEDLWVTEYMNWNPVRRYALRRLSQEEVDAANWNVEGARPTFPRKPSRPR